MDDLLLILFRTTLVLTLCGGVCFLALRRIESRVPKLSRLLWVAVLLTGWFWLQPVIQIPIGETADLRPQTVADFAVPAFVEPPTMVGSRPPGGYVGDSRQEPETAIYDVVVAPSAEYRTLSPGGRQPTIIETDNPIPAQERADVSPPVAPPRGSSATNRQVYAQPLLLAIWFGGMGIVILLSTTAYLRILLSLRKATCADETLSASWWQLLTKHGISPKAVPMVITQHLGPALVRTPLGYRLAVPGELWSELSESGRQGILKHEFAHFRRRDVWKSFFVRMLALPHWFNPVAHYAANRFDELAEQLCDRDAFCSETLKGRQEELSEFARILLLLHDNAPTRFVARQSIFGRNSGNNLQSRIASLNAHPLTERTSVMKKTVLVLGTAAILFAALFRVEFVAQEPPRESATETEEVVAVADATAVLDLTVHRPSGSIALGQDATYTIEITNTGTKVAEDVEIVMSFGEPLEPIAVAGREARYDKGQVFFEKIPTIFPGQRITLRVSAAAKRVGTAQVKAEVVRSDGSGNVRVEQMFAAHIVNRPLIPLTASTDSGNTIPGALQASPLTLPPLEFRVEKPQNVVVGQETVYRIFAKNISNTPVEHVVVNVEIPAWIHVRSADASAGQPLFFVPKSNGLVNLEWSVGRIPPATAPLLSLQLIPQEKRAIELAMSYDISRSTEEVPTRGPAIIPLYNHEAAPSSPALLASVDPAYLALLQKRVEVAKLEFETVTSANERVPNTVPPIEVARAELALAEAEFALRQYQRGGGGALLQRAASEAERNLRVPADPFDPQVARGTAPLAAPSSQRELLVQGKTFEQWRELLLTELDPTIRAEAFRAFALFGANGRGKEATEAIVDAVKGVDFTTIGGDNPIERMKEIAIESFASQSVRIPLEDSLPILMEKFANGNRNERTFVEAAFIQMCNHFDDEKALDFVKGAIQKNDEDRFQLFFSPFRHRTDNGYSLLSGVPLGLVPNVAVNVGYMGQRQPGQPVQAPVRAPSRPIIRLTPFGQSLLALLQEEGVRSENELIRTTSQQVVEALTQIAELMRE